MSDNPIIPLPPGFVLEDELEDYYPVSLVTAYRPGGDWDMGLDPGVEGPDLDAHDTPILGRSTMEDYLEGRAEYVTVAMDKASSWQDQFLKSPNYPGVVFQVRDNGEFGNNSAGNDWVDIAYRDPVPAQSQTDHHVPFKPITEEEANEMRRARKPLPDGFVMEEEYLAGQGAQEFGGADAEPRLPTREEEQRTGGKGPNYPEEDRIPLEGEGEAKPMPKGFLPIESVIEPANIDVSKREPVKFKDGWATVYSMGIEEDGVYTVIPRVVGDEVVSPDEAIAHYHQTGEHLGKFKDQPTADAAAQNLHEQEQQRIAPVMPIRKALAAEGVAVNPELEAKGQNWFFDALNSFGRGGIGDFLMPFQAGYSIGARYLPEGSEMQKRAKEQEAATQALRDHVEKNLPVDEDFARSIAGGVTRGIGQLTSLPFYTVPGVGESFTVGQLYQEARDDYKDSMKRQGKPIDPEQEHRVAMKYVFPSVYVDDKGHYKLSVGAGIPEIFGDKLIVGKALKPLIGKVTVGQLVKTLSTMGKVGGVTESWETYWLNWIAREGEKYEPDRPLDQGVFDSLLIGAMVEGTGGVLAEGVVAPREGEAMPKPPPMPPEGKGPAPAEPQPAPAPAAPVTPAAAKEVPAPPVAPEFGPVAGGVRASLEKNLSPEEKGQAEGLTAAAMIYAEDFDAEMNEYANEVARPDRPLNPAEQAKYAHQQALANVPEAYKPAFQNLPRNAMQAEPAQFGEWLARAYEGGKAPGAVPGKSVAQMVREAKVTVQEQESRQALDELAGEEGEIAIADERVDALIAKYSQGAAPYVVGRRKIQQQILESKAMDNFPEELKNTTIAKMFAIEDMVGADFDKLGVDRKVSDNVRFAGVAFDRLGNITLEVNPGNLYRDEMINQSKGAPEGLTSRITNGEELIHAADLKALKDEWLKNPIGQDFHQFVAKYDLKMAKDMRDTLDNNYSAKDAKALYQGLLDSWNAYRSEYQDEDKPSTYKTGMELLDRQIVLLSSPDKQHHRIPVSFFAEWVRQAKQLERQGVISESVLARFLDDVKRWVKEMLARLKKTLPQIKAGAYGKIAQQRLQAIDDQLAGKDFLGRVPSTYDRPVLYRPAPEDMDILRLEKKHGGPFALNEQENPKTIINIGMTYGKKGGVLTEQRVQDSLAKRGVKVLASDVNESTYVHDGKTITEKVFVAEIEKAMDEETALLVSKDTKQDAIGQREGANGELYGPKAEKWRPFNEDYFVNEVLFRMSAEKLEALAKQYEEFKDWYDNLDEGLNGALGEYVEYAPLFKEFLAALSQISGVKGNVTETVRVLKQFIEEGTIRHMLPAKKTNIERALRGEPIEGPKVSPFSAAMFGDISATALDRHVGMILFGTKTPSDKQHKIGHERIAQVAARLGWTNRQLQAALFAADIIQGGKTVERYETSIRDRQEEIREILSRDITGRGREAARRIDERVRAGRSVEEGGGPVITLERPGGRGAAGTPATPTPSSPAGATGPATPDFGPTVSWSPERLFFGASQFLDKVPGLRPVAEAMRAHVDTARALKGRFGNPFRVWRNEAQDRDISMATNRNYWRAEDSGRAVDAANIRTAASPEAQKLIGAVDKNLNEMMDLAVKEGYMIIDPSTGRMRPFKKGAHVWPRMIRQDVLQVFNNPKDLKGYRKLRDELINSGVISMTSPDADMTKLRTKVMDMVKSKDVMTNVDLNRTNPLPHELYDYSFNAMRRFIDSFSESLARQMSLGPKVGGRGKDIFDRFKEKAGDPQTRNYLQLLQDNAYNTRYAVGGARFAAASNELASFLQLANPRSVQRNWLTGLAFSMAHFGPIRTLKPMFDIAGTYHAIEDARERGAIADDLMNVMSDGEQIMAEKPRLTARLAQAGFKYSGWSAVENFVRGVSYQAAKSWLRDSINHNLANPRSRASLLARGRLQRLGLNANEVLLEGGSGPWTDRFLRAAVAEIQGGYQYDQTPGYADSQAGRFFVKYRKFGTQALMHFDREVIRPAARAFSGGHIARETVKVRDPVTGKVTEHKVPGDLMPAVSFLVLMLLAGAADEWLADNLFGIPNRSASMAEILSRMNRDQVGAFKMLLGKLAGYMISAGGLGLLGDFMQAGGNTLKGRNPIDDLLQIPALSPFVTAWNAVRDVYSSGGQVTGKMVDDMLKKIWSGYRVGGQVAARAADVLGADLNYTESIRRRQDMSWLRGVTARFNDEMKVRKRPGLPPGGRVMAKEDPFREQLKDFLLIGDTKSANRMIKEHFKVWSPERQKEEMKKLKASVRGSQPIYAGPGGGEVARELFLRWARTSLSKAEQARLRDLDKTYREAAQALDLMSDKAVKEEDVEELEERLRVLAE